jgi:hypothetical protein
LLLQFIADYRSCNADHKSLGSASVAAAGDAISAHFYMCVGYKVTRIYSVASISGYKVTRIYSVASTTGRTMWIMNLFIFEWGDEMKVSLFGIKITSV